MGSFFSADRSGPASATGHLHGQPRWLAWAVAAYAVAMATGTAVLMAIWG